MYRFEDLRLRRFRLEDIPLKIQWINDPANHRFLHYDLPLEYEKTRRWFEGVKDRRDRFDAVIEYRGRPVGLIGLLNIDRKNGKAEEYIALGERDAKGKGVAARAGLLNQLYGFRDLGLNKIYAYTEMENLPAMRLYRSRGFHVDGYLRDDLRVNGRYVDRQLLSLREADMKMPEGVYTEKADAPMNYHNLEIGGGGGSSPSLTGTFVLSPFCLYCRPVSGLRLGKEENEYVPV